MSNMNYKGLLLVRSNGCEGIPLDIHCPLRRRIRDDTLDLAFRRIFERHGDLQCLRHFLSRAFFVLPGFVRVVDGRRVTSTDNITRRDC
jgi:hypothetical protein